MLSMADLNATGLEGVILTQLSKPQSQFTRELYDLWKELKGEQEMPSKSDFKPERMKAYLPNLYIVDIIDGGADYRLRLIGTALTQMVGRDMTGHLISAVPETQWRGRIYDTVVRERAPVGYLSQLGRPGGPAVTTENIVLPALDMEGEFSELVCASVLVKGP
ncbi:PAS domain-containing protein [Kordiimonas lacus]|uniref:PAS domain-containing protein n=2 Tax=Kordiimonas lacus TaxID=637679 RepID=A0A1G6VIA3_9PROT|nr:PAS domain-containing protein [Kordiimonas lacus]